MICGIPTQQPPDTSKARSGPVDLPVGNTHASVEFSKPSIDLGQEYQSLDQ